MTYLLAKKNKRSLAFRWMAALAALLVVLRLFVFTEPSRLPAAIAPLWRAEQGVRAFFADTVALARTKRSLVEENEALLRKVRLAEEELASKRILEEENATLRSALGRDDESPLIAAGVLAKPNRSPYDTLIVDAGEEAGIKAHARVYTGGGLAIGRVLEASRTTATIMLYSTPGQVVYVSFPGLSLSEEIAGRGGGNFEVRLPRDISVPEGTEAVLPGLSGGLVAIVEEVVHDPRDPFQRVLLRAPFNIQGLSAVFIEQVVSPDLE